MICRPFKRGIRIRVSGVLIRDNALLLVAHRKRGETYWLLPGGGVQYGESLVEALRREFMEELCVEVEVGRFLFACDSIDPFGKRHIMNVSFLSRYRDGEFAVGRDHRVCDYGFFSRDEIPAMRIYPPIQGTLVAILDRGEYPPYLGSLWQS